MGRAEFSFCAKRGKENPSRRKENPSLGEGKSKLCLFRELSVFKGLRQPLGHFARGCSTAVSLLGTIGLAIEAAMAE